MAGKFYTPAVKQATEKYKKENMEQVKFWAPMGYKMKYAELAKKRGESMASLIMKYLNAECEKEGIELVKMTREELEAKKEGR